MGAWPPIVWCLLLPCLAALAGGPSQPYFVEQLEKQCLELAGVFAWEVTFASPDVVWREIPGYLKSRYRWFNVPATTGTGDWDNPLTHIAAVATPDDYVMFKLDIDNNDVEEAIVAGLMASPHLMNLIDEMVWEHHVRFEPLVGAWHTDNSPKIMNDSLALFSAMRRAGMRIHSWI